MSHPAQVGKNNFNQAVARGRLANMFARKNLSRIVEEQPGPQVTALLIARASLNLGEIGDVFDELEQIGRKARGK
jgi:hypothetical protein